MIRLLFIALILNLSFFWSAYFFGNTLYSGKDIVRIHYASKFYLYESFQNNFFPIWTDKMFGGYNIFFDLERGFQNILNLLFVYLFGPINSLKLLFITAFIIGFVSFSLLLQKSFKLNWVVSVTLPTIYFFSYLSLSHIQHQNIIFSIFLLPTIIYLTSTYLEKKDNFTLFSIIFIYYFLVTFGSLQTVFINVIFHLLYISVNCKNYKLIIKNALLLIAPSFILTLPSIYYFFQMYLDSVRSTQFVSGQGSFNLLLIGSYILPFFLGLDSFFGTTLNSNLFKQESMIYFSLSGIVFSTFIVLNKEKQKMTYKFLLISSSMFLLIVNFWNHFPFDIFRYWVRATYILNFAVILLIADFISNEPSNTKLLKTKIVSKLNLYQFFGIGFMFFLLFFNFFNKDFRYLFFTNISEYQVAIFVYIIILILTILVYIFFPKKFIFLIIFELLFSLTLNNFNLSIPTESINQIRSQINIYENTNDDYSLLKNGPSLSGYSALVPRYSFDDSNYYQKYNLTNFLVFYFISIISTILFVYGIKRYVFHNKKI